MLSKFSQVLVAAGLVMGAALAAAPASAAPAGVVAVPAPDVAVTKAQYYGRPYYRPGPPRRVCRWETVRVRGAYGRWYMKRVQRCYVRR